MDGDGDETGPNEASGFVWALGEFFFYIFVVLTFYYIYRL
jgi:hypothetical protein